MFPSQEQRDQFLQAIRDGFDRSQAAQQVGLTGMIFRRVCNREADFLKAYEEAFAEGAETRRQRKDGRCMGKSGFWEPDEEMKEDFLQLVREGYSRYEAAMELGHTATRWREVLRRDDELRLLYEEALSVGESERIERIRSEYWRRAIEGGSDRLLANLGMTHLPEMRVLLTRRMEIANAEGEALKILAGQAMQLTDEELRALDERLKEMSAADLKELEAGEVIDIRAAEG